MLTDSELVRGSSGLLQEWLIELYGKRKCSVGNLVTDLIVINVICYIFTF